MGTAVPGRPRAQGQPCAVDARPTTTGGSDRPRHDGSLGGGFGDD